MAAGVAAGVRGRLISASYIRDLLPVSSSYREPTGHTARALEAWQERCHQLLGPASGRRAVADVAIVPLLHLLELAVTGRTDGPDQCALRTHCRDRPGPDVLVVGWNEPLQPAWRVAMRQAARQHTRWVLCTNGVVLRVIDASRTWSRAHLELDLALVATRSDAQAVLWTFLHADAITSAQPPLDGAITESQRHGVEIRRSLGRGVLDAVGILLRNRPARATPHDVLFEHGLTVVFRLLFLLFAEARGLVPMWHPVYRDRYSLEQLVEDVLHGGRLRGLWPAIRAISRLAHTGCEAGELRVNAFNGRLFSASATASFDRAPLTDAAVTGVLTALGTAKTRAAEGRRRIIYGDLDVEQLGAVYEKLLEYAPADTSTLVRNNDERKATGTFYTPREVTAFLVERTLAPLVAGRTADEILALRILDPAMGSGAFLVAACRYLAAAAEHALIREGVWHRADVTAVERVALRRTIALRCLYGVDLNPTAVQLARLSLWLTTMAADKPLSFLDHHLVAGDSLLGATPDDVRRQPPQSRTSRRIQATPLLDGLDVAAVLDAAARVRSSLASKPDDTAAAVREKSRRLAALSHAGGDISRWTRLLDLWCAGWFFEDAALDRGLYGDLAQSILTGRSALPESVTGPLLAQAASIAAGRRFLHWPLAFPEVFAGGTLHGATGSAGGFDAIIGNPPWDMLRGDSGADAVRHTRQRDARLLLRFVRGSGIYRADSRAHLNRYQLFVERALQLVRRGGRIGLVLPGGFTSDVGAASVRRQMFDAAGLDTLTTIDNRHAVFPIHRGVRIALVTGTAGVAANAVTCRFGVTSSEQLSSEPAGGGTTGTAADLTQDGNHERAPTILLSRPLLSRLSGADDLSIPELSSGMDLRIVERVSARHRWLSDAAGWGATFGRELNASDDRGTLEPVRRTTSARVVEGKQVEPFGVRLDACRYALRRHAPLPESARRPRLVFRDVAGAGNRLTLIAAVVPAGAVTTHTLHCLRMPAREDDHYVLAALLNSFVANYLVRMRVSTHVTAFLVGHLPVPQFQRDGHAYRRLLSLSRRLHAAEGPAHTRSDYVSLQANCAQLYGVARDEFARVLETFPLVEEEVRSQCLRRFEDSQS